MIAMILYFATEARFVKRDGLFYSLGGFSYELWQRYLHHFDSITVIARVTDDPSIIVDDTMLASSSCVDFIELPYYIGLSGYIKNRKLMRRILSEKLPHCACYLCRLPGQVGGEVIRFLRRKHIPYSCEVVGNPWDVFAKGSVNHPLRPLIRYISSLRLKRQVYNAQACLYVTKTTLQKEYPVRSSSFSIGVSDVIIRNDIIASLPKCFTIKEQYSLISIGSLSQMYKSPDIVLSAMALLKNRGYNIKLTWLGDGRFRNEMSILANELRLDVEFKGNVPSSEVHSCLEQADVFVLASRTEGLPRAVVEAMAHGLPCIGTRVGGIPELLENIVLVEKEDSEGLADIIQKLITDPELYNSQARRNLIEASSFLQDRLDALRTSFFNFIKFGR